jgi:60 kDa SS-A/Ro ribonucleoprotein
VVRQLDTTFRLAFGNVPATNQRLQLALDVSGSMTDSMVGMSSGRKKGKGLPLTSREASAALALVTMNVEKKRMVTGFSAQGTAVLNNMRNNGISQLALHEKMSLAEVCRYTASLSFGRTDCALPMLYALEHGLDFDAFIIYTDNETNSNSIHPSVALKQYRERTGIPAKLVVVAMESDGFSIADPNDAGMLDVVGFDLATPQVMTAFLGAELQPTLEEE